MINRLNINTKKKNIDNEIAEKIYYNIYYN